MPTTCYRVPVVDTENETRVFLSQPLCPIESLTEHALAHWPVAIPATFFVCRWYTFICVMKMRSESSTSF